MKSFIIGLAMFIVSIGFTVFQQDYNLHQQHLYRLKFTAQEAAAAASQYYVKEEYGKGKFVFNQGEAIQAAEYIMAKQLKLDDFLLPQENSYWQEPVQYTIEFFDDANAAFPFLYEHDQDLFTLTITNPSVIITINAGNPRYRMLDNPPNCIRVAAHEWKDR